MRITRIVSLIVLLLCSPATRADVLVGRVPGTTTTPPDSVANCGDETSGNAAPQALLGGASTGLQSANAMTYDADQRTLLVTDFYGRRIRVFAATSPGDVAPLRSIEGAATLMTNAGGLSCYALRDELLAASGSSNAVPHVLGFPRNGSGNLAPSRDISGASTGGSFGNGWTGVVGLPLVEIFKRGFE